MFYAYGIPVDFVINQNVHIREVSNRGKNISKFPPQFGIDIHIDDSIGVKMEGEKHGYRTIIVFDKYENWSKNILENL
jgi:hypothetical protein